MAAVSDTKCPLPKGWDAKTLPVSSKYCREFIVARGRSATNVVVMSLWAGDAAYAHVLKKALPFWVDVFPRISCLWQWNARIYIDRFSWDWIHDAFPQALPPHLEIYLYDCPSIRAIGGEDKTTVHPNTFGSLVRFHALTDASLQHVLVRNVEQFTSPEDLHWLSVQPAVTTSHLWAYTYRPYHIRQMMEHMSLYLDKMLMFSMPLAGVLWWKRPLAQPLPWSFDEFLCESSRVSMPVPFAYGVDEVVLSVLIQRIAHASPKSLTFHEQLTGPLSVDQANTAYLVNRLFRLPIYKSVDAWARARVVEFMAVLMALPVTWMWSQWSTGTNGARLAHCLGIQRIWLAENTETTGSDLPKGSHVYSAKDPLLSDSKEVAVHTGGHLLTSTTEDWAVRVQDLANQPHRLLMVEREQDWKTLVKLTLDPSSGRVHVVVKIEWDTVKEMVHEVQTYLASAPTWANLWVVLSGHPSYDKWMPPELNLFFTHEQEAKTRLEAERKNRYGETMLQNLSLSFAKNGAMAWFSTYALERKLFFGKLPTSPDAFPPLEAVVLANPWKVKGAAETAFHDMMRQDTWREVVTSRELFAPPASPATWTWQPSALSTLTWKEAVRLAFVSTETKAK
jgi:hypothetical protein